MGTTIIITRAKITIIQNANMMKMSQTLNSIMEEEEAEDSIAIIVIIKTDIKTMEMSILMEAITEEEEATIITIGEEVVEEIIIIKMVTISMKSHSNQL